MNLNTVIEEQVTAVPGEWLRIDQHNYHTVSHWSNPAPYKPDRCLMLMGEIDTFYEDRGYGFLEAPEGRIFFHVSGFRQPRLWENPKYSPPKPEIQLVDLHTKLSTEKRRKGEKPERIPVPPLPKQTVVLFEMGQRHNRPQACLWCLRDVFIPLLHELEAQYEAALYTWRREAIYKLTLHKRSYGQYKANNELKRMVREEHVHVSTLFEGTNTNFLQSWFQDCRDSYRLNGDCWIELHYREWDDRQNQHGEWQQCPSEMMHDFLG